MRKQIFKKLCYDKMVIKIVNILKNAYDTTCC